MAIDQVLAVIADDYRREVRHMVNLGFPEDVSWNRVHQWWTDNVYFALASAEGAWDLGVGGGRHSLELADA